MRIVIQRVSLGRVSVEDETIGEITLGQAILVGVGTGDTEADAAALARKAYGLRIFEDGEGKMNLAAADVGGEFLVISQFTLYGDTSRGRRPSFIDSAPPDVGERLYERFVSELRQLGGHVETGRFGAHMHLDIHNDGPVTIIIDSGTGDESA